MNLAVDIGNTFIKVGLFDQDKIKESHQLESKENLLKYIALQNINYLILSSVKKGADEIINVLPSSIKVFKLTSETSLPITNLYKTPATLGPDRLAGAVGAYNLFPNTNCLVVDAGTSITMDFIDNKGNYHGGSIAPGVRMRLKALHTFTDKLPLVDSQEIDYVIGKTTVESILSGVLNGIIFEVEGFINQYVQLFSQLNVIITGGDSYSFESRIKQHIFVVPNLLLLGLNKILQFNLTDTSV